MSDVHNVLKDILVDRYSTDSTFLRWYTCFPRKDESSSYDCTNIQFDPWTDKYDMSTWKEYNVPKIIPRKYHGSYIKFKNHLANVNIVSEKSD